MVNELFSKYFKHFEYNSASRQFACYKQDQELIGEPVSIMTLSFLTGKSWQIEQTQIRSIAV